MDFSSEHNSTRRDEIEFNQAHSQIQQEIESYLESTGQFSTEVPKISFEQGDIKFSFNVSSISMENLYEGIKIIKKHIVNLQVRDFDDGYIVFHDIGDLYSSDRKSFSQGIRFKFISVSSNSRIEVQRKGKLIQDEVQACLHLFQLFHKKNPETNPEKMLQKLGAEIFSPEEKRKPTENEIRISFKGFAGYSKVREEVLDSVILPLSKPEVFDQIAKATRGTSATNLPRAVLFEGPAGVGKTSMAKIIARETQIPLVCIAVENILSKYYGESAQNLANIFDAASLYERVILFIDEIDSLAVSREGGIYEATRRLLSVLLRKIDGIEQKKGLLTLGATNRTQDLDPALLSRFDTVIHFPLPSIPERNSIFRVYASHLSQQELLALAQASEELSGRNIEDICEYTERYWARKTIMEQKQISSPPGELYLEITKEMLPKSQKKY